MKFSNNIGDEAIQDVVKAHPGIGDILNDFEIGCVDCSVGICLLKDVVAIHALGDEIEAKIEVQINDYLDNNH
jgi:hypothetical protein